MFNGWLKYHFVNTGIVLLVSFAWFCLYSHFLWQKKKTLGSIAYVLLVWFMCWWCSQRNILGVLLYCYVIPPRQVSLILELDRQPRKPSISCLFTPHSVGCTDTFSHSQFFVDREWNLSPHSKWSYPVSHLLRHKLLSNWFHLLCLCFSLMCSHGLLSTCSFNFEVFSKSF